MPKPTGLRGSDFPQTEGAGEDKYADDGQSHVELIADHLSGGPQPSQQRVFAVRSPSTEDDAVGADRREGQDVENADIDVADHERLDRDAEEFDFVARTEGDDCKT